MTPSAIKVHTLNRSTPACVRPRRCSWRSGYSDRSGRRRPPASTDWSGSLYSPCWNAALAAGPVSHCWTSSSTPWHSSGCGTCNRPDSWADSGCRRTQYTASGSSRSAPAYSTRCCWTCTSGRRRRCSLSSCWRREHCRSEWWHRCRGLDWPRTDRRSPTRAPPRSRSSDRCRPNNFGKFSLVLFYAYFIDNIVRFFLI